MNHLKEFIVYPSSLRYGLFTTAATDNIDANPKSSFHRTVTYNYQNIHELYGNARDTSNTISHEAELNKACQISNKHIYHRQSDESGINKFRRNEKLRKSFGNYDFAANRKEVQLLEHVKITEVPEMEMVILSILCDILENIEYANIITNALVV